ncbi:MAG: TerC family protein [Bacteroidia bacterium]|nr:TerC family protein [Bacteroidia bacterium]MDW8088807.1 TerC family protein [Bacteroidia bacterium]
MSSLAELFIGLFTLTLMEIALGIDNLIVVGLILSAAPAAHQRWLWRFWMLYAPLIRLFLLTALVGLLAQSRPLFSVLGYPFSLRHLLLLGGGLFLLYKGVREIHSKLEGSRTDTPKKSLSSLFAAIVQIAIVEIIFSADSILTAIGMTQNLVIMWLSILLSLGITLWAARWIQRLLANHPTLKILALAFLLLIGVLLVGEGTGLHVPKGYLYFAILFSLGVEWLNIRAGLRHQER